MVLDQKTNFFLGKRWFWTEKPTFQKKKQKKTHLLGNFMAKLKKDSFFGFP